MVRHRTPIGLLAAAAVPLAGLAVSGCGGGGDSNGSPAPPTTASGRAATVGVGDDGNLGRILVDSRGRTVYLFQKDAGTKSTCAGACAAAWPPLVVTGRPVAGSGASAAKIGITARSDGGRQVTYNGHPLYRYSADQKPGDTNGQGLNAFGAPWFALSAAGNMVSGTGTNPGGGY